ncbi:MAG TPA: ACT domain-containing protein [Rhodocyclaceae bacterium]|nr:ACT domain-containing protein [Rhodocyclaceae bacterium]
MDVLVEAVDVWVATIPDQPGGLAEALAVVRDAGADLQFVIARRTPEEPGKGVVFITPLQGDREVRAATQVGFGVAQSLHSVRVMGQDRPGVAAQMTRALADAGINLRGFSGCSIGSQFVAYIAVDTLEDAEKITDALQRA